MIVIRLLLPALSAVTMTVAIAITSDVVGPQVKVNWVLCQSNSLSVFPYIDTYVCPYISRHISRVQAKAGVWAATQSLVALLPSYSPPPPNAAWATALSDWLPVRGTPTDPQSLRPETNIEERHILEETQRYTAEKQTEGEKKERAKRGGGCDMWQVGVPTAHRYLPFLFLIVFQ